VLDGKFEPATQVAGFDDLIAAGVDGIVIQPVDAVALAPSVQAAREAGILVMFVGGLPDPTSPVPAGGVFNDEELVREAAREALAWLEENKPGEKAKLVLFDIPSIIVCHEWRMEAFRDEVLKEWGEDNVEIVFHDLVDHSLDVVVAKMEDLIQSGADFNIFTACGGTGAVGGMQALKAAGRGNAVNNVPETEWVLSIDATPAELEYLLDPGSSIVKTIALTPKNNAQIFLDNFKKILNGDIDPDDGDYVAVAPGFYVPSDSCVAAREAISDQYANVPGYWKLDCAEFEAGASLLDGLELAFITAGNQSEYQISQGDWFKEFAETEGASVTVLDGKFEPATQVTGMDDLIAAGVDGIVIQPVDAVALAPSVQAAREAGIIVMFVGGLPDPTSPVPAGGVFNDEELVREAAQEALAWLEENKPGEKAKLVLFDIPSIIVCHEWRMEAFRDEVLNEWGEDNVEIVFHDLVDHSLDVVVAKMEDLIQSGADFNIFTACGGTGAVGGMQALQAAGRGMAENNVPLTEWVLSIDATPAELEYLLDTESSVIKTIALTPKNNALIFLENFKKILSGELDPDDGDYVAVAPGFFVPSDSCVAAREAISDQYANIPGYWKLDCSEYEN
jgi:ABC-type sugar transport system substrate-binding protein